MEAHRSTRWQLSVLAAALVRLRCWRTRLAEEIRARVKATFNITGVALATPFQEFPVPTGLWGLLLQECEAASILPAF